MKGDLDRSTSSKKNKSKKERKKSEDWTEDGGEESFFEGCLGLGGELGMGGEEAGVDGWDDGEEGDGFFAGIGEEGGGEARPDGVWGEGVQELDSGAGQKGREKGIHYAVDVMKWKDV